MNAKDLYLKRVARWLPAAMRADVIAELDTAIEDYLDSAAPSRSGTEIYSLLVRDFGHPAVAATRFVDGKPVIRAGLAHVYWRVLAIACPAVVIIQLALALSATGPASPALISVLLKAAGHFFFSIGVITAAFVFLDGGWRTLCRLLGAGRQ